MLLHQMHVVIELVLLKISLYFGSRFCIYLVDFVFVCLVSYRNIIAGACGVLVMRFCIFGNVVLSDATFHVMTWISWFMKVRDCSWLREGCSEGIGCVYFVMGSWHLSSCFYYKCIW